MSFSLTCFLHVNSWSSYFSRTFVGCFIKKFDCFICNYHDQALIPFKIISNYSGVNYTSGLDIIRVSPDHGTAYDIVGKKNKSSLGIINSFKLVKKIAQNSQKRYKMSNLSFILI